MHFQKYLLKELLCLYVLLLKLKHKKYKKLGDPSKCAFLNFEIKNF